MQQHNSTLSEEGRNFWKPARERVRRQARFEIRQRITEQGKIARCTPSSSSTVSTNDATGVSLPTASATAAAEEEPGDGYGKRVRDVLRRIVEGDRSFFSLQYLNDNVDFLTRPIPSNLVWLDDRIDTTNNYKTRSDEERDWIGRELVRSWRGLEAGPLLERYLETVESFTFVEYCVWLQRFHILGSFISNGINPCVRGRTKCERDMRKDREQPWAQDLVDYGVTTLLPFLVRVMPPLTLSSHAVNRVVEMRFRVLMGQSHDLDVTEQCPICCKCPPSSFCLSFHESCHHIVCELCVWKDIVQYWELEENEIFQCPLCRNQGAPLLGGNHHESFSSQAASERCQKSLQQYLALPANAKELKERLLLRQEPKRQKHHESKILCATWSQAVLPSLGLTRDVRRDKFFAHIEKGSYHHVKGCLEQGIDVHLCNEYGQTALYLATWLHGNKSSACLVRILLHYGSDPCQKAHGGSTPIAVARSHGYTLALKLLLEACNNQSIEVDQSSGPLLMNESTSNGEQAVTSEEDLDSIRQSWSPPKLTVLIDTTVDHQGAGSYVIDDAVSDGTIKQLLSLWKRLPIEESTTHKKHKKALCSVRSYFCDAHGELTSLIVHAISRSGYWQQPYTKSHHQYYMAALPHMRFLCYSQAGTVLAPHVDLCRVDHSTGKRSTHSFLLYLTTCETGGETTLLGNLSGEGRNQVFAKVKPKRGRLLLFPHNCPHEGEKVLSVPKLLIRGEVIIPSFRSEYAYD